MRYILTNCNKGDKILYMITSVRNALHDWSATTDSRQKLQHTYAGAAICLVIAAGMIGLVNYDLGQRILLIAIVSVALFFINAITWALLQSFVLLKLATSSSVQDKAASKPVGRKPQTTVAKTAKK